MTHRTHARHSAMAVTLLTMAFSACSSPRDTDPNDSTTLMTARTSLGNDSLRARGPLSDSTTGQARGAVSATPTSAPVTDTVLANLIATVDRGEIEAGTLAVSKAANATVKAYARSMIAAHTKDLSTTMRLLKGNNLPVADSTAVAAQGAANADLVSQALQKHRDVMATLGNESGAAFDRLYIDAMVTGHQAFLATLQQHAAGASLAPVKDHALAVQQVVTSHLTRAKEIQERLAARAAAPTP